MPGYILPILAIPVTNIAQGLQFLLTGSTQWELQLVFEALYWVGEYSDGCED